MARVKGTTSTAQPKPKNGTLALARAAAVTLLKKPEAEWRVELNPDLLKEPLPHLPTGSLIIDYLIGGDANSFGVRPCPGLPRGRVSQLWGHESAGKTTLALTAAAVTCAQGGTVLYIDWENDIVPDYAAALGVPISDPTKFELVQPNTLEDGIKLAMIYASAGVDLIVFDSVGAAVPARIANREMSDAGEQAKVGDLQAVWSMELPNLKSIIARKGTAVLGISQIRAKISTMPSNGPTAQPQGGNAWKFYSSVRLELRRVKNEKSNLYNALTHKKDERVTGGIIRAKVIKCKLSSSQGREEAFYIRWGTGIDDMRSVMEIASAHNIIKKKGAWMEWGSPSGLINKQGVNQFREHLEANPDDFQALYHQVLPFLGQGTFTEDDLEDIDEVGNLLAEMEDTLLGDGEGAPKVEENEDSE